MVSRQYSYALRSNRAVKTEVLAARFAPFAASCG